MRRLLREAGLDRPARFLPLILAACAVLFYWQVLSYGLWFDDYMDLRPWGKADAWRALTGAWSVQGWQDPYHRPLSSLLTFLLFELFGLNTRALHATSLAGLALIVIVLFEAVRRLVDRRWATVVVVAYLLHPVLPNSTIAWVGNLKHVAAVVTVVSAFWWWAARGASVTWRAWWPIAACAVVGFYVKEDTVMVLPALLVTQWIVARSSGARPAPTAALWAGSAGLLAVLALVRMVVLPEAAGSTDLFFERPLREALLNAAYTPARALFVIRYQGEIMWWATAFVTLLVVAGGVAAARQPSSIAGRLWILGACLGAAFSAPLLFAIDMTTMRAHLVTLAASLVWTGGVAALWQWATLRHVRVLVGAVVVLGALRLGFIVQRQLDERFGPCGWETGNFDRDVSAWPDNVIPADTKAWLARKTAVCEDERTPYLWDEVDAIRWRTEDGIVALVSTRLTRARLEISPGSGDAWLMGPQGVIAHLPDGTGGSITIALPTSWRSWLRDSHRLMLRTTSPRDLTITPIR